MVTSNLYIPDMQWMELMHAPAGTATLCHGFGRDGRQFGMKRFAIVWMTALPHLRTLEPYRALLLIDAATSVDKHINKNCSDLL